MLRVLANRTYRHLFLAQVIALAGTGLATVALGLLAFDLAGADAGAVLGTALAIKMIAYVGVAPVAAAFAEQLPRRPMLVCLDFLRAAVALLLPFVSEGWQVYVSFHSLFAGTVFGFLASASLVISVALPSPKAAERRGIYDRTTRGLRIYLATPRLRGLLARSLAISAAGSMVIVNTVVFVQAEFGLTQHATAIALAAFGGGSMIAALLLPRVLDKTPDRTAMLAGAALLVAGLFIGVFVPSFALLLALWVAIGFGYSLTQTPSGRLLRRSSHPEDRPALFAALRAVARLLADHLSACRMAWREGRSAGDFRHARCDRRSPDRRCDATLARA
ncbi:hypothetical protein SAMCCGM7_pC0783 (plasmid) [Sinorhizobium americanum CCGM7]|nr:hypothetical protein SAMCCGM7_pC0783 [Sinorhizobium americanum CCGM7]